MPNNLIPLIKKSPKHYRVPITDLLIVTQFCDLSQNSTFNKRYFPEHYSPENKPASGCLMNITISSSTCRLKKEKFELNRFDKAKIDFFKRGQVLLENTLLGVRNKITYSRSIKVT